MKTTIVEVKTDRDFKDFVHFPNELYKDNEYYVPQIESMDRAMLDPKTNHAFEVCEGKYFLARNEDGKVVGRVAAIINHEYNKSIGEAVCRFGWLDFVEDDEVLDALLGAVENYAKEHSLTRLSGPVGFLEFDVAGVLVEGFDQIPSPYGKYNAPYYDAMIKARGYEKEVDWVEFLVDISDYDHSRNHHLAQVVAERNGLHQAPITRRRHIKPYVDGIFDVMNRCYANIHGYSQLTAGQLADLKNQFLPNADPDLISVILDGNEKVVAFMFWLPSLSKAMQKAKGSLFPFGWIHILRAMRHNDTVNSLLIAVSPEYQNKGLNAMFFDKVYKGVKRIGIKYIETTRELEINNSVINLAGHYDRKLIMRSRCYTKNIK